MKDRTVGIIYTLSLVAFLMWLLFPAVLLSFLPLFVFTGALTAAALPVLSRYISIAQTICKIE